MRRALPDELNEDVAPALVLNIPETRVYELFPVPFDAVDPFAEAEPSRSALVVLNSGSMVVVTYGLVTKRTTISVPNSQDVGRTILDFFGELKHPDVVEWISDEAQERLRGPSDEELDLTLEYVRSLEEARAKSKIAS